MSVIALSCPSDHDPPSFGNFCNRALKFVSNQYGSVLPDSEDPEGPLSPNDETDSEFISDVNALLQEYITSMDAVKLRGSLHTIMAISQRGNSYLQSSSLGKELMAKDPKRCAQVVSRVINLIYILSALVYPFMPSTSDSILRQLNAPARIVPDVFSTDILAGHVIGKPEHLFKPIDEGLVDKLRSKFGGLEGASSKEETPTPRSKKAKGKAEKAPVSTVPLTPEMIALEQEIATQGALVRTLKSQTKTPEIEAQINSEVDLLKKLKGALAQLQQAK